MVDVAVTKHQAEDRGPAHFLLGLARSGTGFKGAAPYWLRWSGQSRTALAMAAMGGSADDARKASV